MLVVSHLALAIIPSIFVENKFTVLVPYYSLFAPLEIFRSIGLPVYGQVNEDVFMAPITNLGWALVVALWLVIHYGISQLLSHLTMRSSKDGLTPAA